MNRAKKLLSCLLLTLLALPALPAALPKAKSDKLIAKNNSQPHAYTFTKTEKILLSSAALYAIHRGVQWYLRSNIAESATQNKCQEKVISNAKGIVTLFAHGLGGNRNHGKYYQEHLNVFFQDQRVSATQQLHVFDFQDSTLLPQNQQMASCIGQDADIQKIKQEYDKLVAQGYQVILHGVSRGAATIVNFLAQCQPKNVRCAILESPFDDVESVVKHKLGFVQNIPLVGSMLSAAGTALAPKLPLGLDNYSVYKINPLDCVTHISKDTPLLFIASRQDSLIPHTSTQKLVDALQTAGHTHCHSFIADVGAHATILYDKQGAQIVEIIKKFVNKPQENPLKS